MKFLLAILIRVQHFVDWVAHENNIIIIMAYTAAFLQTGIQVISASDIGGFQYDVIVYILPH